MYNQSVNSSWTLREQTYLIDNYFKLPIEELALKLQRSYGSIHAKAQDLGLNLNSKKKVVATTRIYKAIPVAPTKALPTKQVDTPQKKETKYRKWTKKDYDFIIDNYAAHSEGWIAMYLNTTVKSLQHKLTKLRKQGKLPQKVSIKTTPVAGKVPQVVKPQSLGKTEVAPMIPYAGSIGEKKNDAAIAKAKAVVSSSQVLTINIDNLKVKELTKLSNFLNESDIEFEIK